MSEFKIEKEIPIFESRGNRGGKEKYPWSKMEVGDSFFVARPINSLGGLLRDAGKRHDAKFSARTVEGGTRIWRVE